MNEPALNSEGPPAAPPSKRSTQMFPIACAVIVGIEFYFATHANVRDSLHMQLGLAMVFFAALPALLWARRGKTSLPVFEVFMFSSANAYAFPLLTGHEELIHYTDDEITTSAIGVLIFQIVADVVYEFTPTRKKMTPFWRLEVITKDISRWLSYGMALNTAYVIISTFTDLIPDAINSIMRAVFFGIGIICTFITSRRLGEGELTPGQRLFFFANITIQCLGMISTIFLVGAVSVLLLTLVGYVSSSGRLPVIPTAAGLILLALLHNGKSTMRTKYWDEGKPMPGLVGMPAFLSEWLSYGSDFSDDPSKKGKVAGKLIERTSLLQMMCLVVSLSPSRQPYLYGETYKDIPAQFVPRIFWPNKPLGHVSNSRLSVYYGLQTEEDTMKTTIGFGMLTEAYANFGFFGMALLASVFAFFEKKVQGWAEDGPIFSYGGLLLIIMLAWSFQVEFTVSIWLASLYQACVAVLGMPYMLRKFFA